MELIDENGNLFGRINVVDALVVLVLLAVVVAGAALVLDQEPEPEPTTATVNATLDLGTQPAFIVDAIEEGDSYSPTEHAALTITDVFTTPTDDGTRVLARVRLTGEKEGGSISYDGGPPRLGRSLSIVTAQYEVSGQIRALGGGRTLTQRQTTVVVRDRLSRTDAAAVEPGDTVELSGRSVATVQNVTLHPTDDPATRLAFLTVELQTVVRDGVPQFGAGAVRDGRSIRLSTPEYTVDGTIQRVGETATTRDSVVVVTQQVDAADTERFTAGTQLQLGGKTVATIQNATFHPTGTPTRRRAFLTLELTAIESQGSRQFAGQRLERGQSLQFASEDVQIGGTIRRVGEGLQQTTRVVVVREAIDTADAAEFTPGTRLQIDGQTVASIREATFHPTGNPARRLAFLTLELAAVAGPRGPEFAGQRLERGSSLAFDSDRLTIDGTIQHAGTTLRTRDRTVVVRQRIDAADTAEYTPGSEIQINGQTALTVQNRTLQPTGDPTQHVAYLTLDLTTVTRQGDSRFAGQTLRRGGGLTVAGDDLRIDGRITALDDTPTVSEQSVVLRTRTAASRARQIAPGDSVTLGRQTVATVDNVSVYSTSDPDERVVFLEASLTAVERGGDFQFGGTPVRRGQQLSLDTGAYTITGRIDSLDSGLAREQTAVLIRDTVDTDTATELTVGDRALVAGQSTATVRNVTVYGTNDPDRKRVAVGLSLQTVDYGEQPQFGGSFVREGNGITLRTEEYTLSGAIERVGTTAQRGTPTTRTVTLRLDEVRSDLAQAITEGMTERSGDTVLAEVTNVSREPSTILIRGDRGDLGVFDHPTLRDVTITADLRVRETSDGVRFKGETIQQGGSVTLDLGTVTVEVTVVRIGS